MPRMVYNECADYKQLDRHAADRRTGRSAVVVAQFGDLLPILANSP